MSLGERLNALDERVLGEERMARWRARAERNKITVPGVVVILTWLSIFAPVLHFTGLFAQEQGWTEGETLLVQSGQLGGVLALLLGTAIGFAATAFGLWSLAFLAAAVIGSLVSSTQATEGWRGVVFVATHTMGLLLSAVIMRRRAGERAGSSLD